jgi:hypothetical protein
MQIQERNPHVDDKQGEMIACRTPLAAGVAQNFVNLSLDILLVVALGVGVVSISPFHAVDLCAPICLILLAQITLRQALRN